MFDASVNLITLEKWLNEKLKSMFKLLADIILNKGEKLKYMTKTPFKSCTINTLINETTKDKIENNEVNKIMTQNPNKVNKNIKCWLCKNKHRLLNCEQLLSKSFIEKKDFVSKDRLCFVWQRVMCCICSYWVNSGNIKSKII